QTFVLIRWASGIGGIVPFASDYLKGPPGGHLGGTFLSAPLFGTAMRLDRRLILALDLVDPGAAVSVAKAVHRELAAIKAGRSRASRFVQGPRASSRPRRVRNGSRRCARSSDPDSSCHPGSGRREGTPARQSLRGPTRSSSVAQSTKPRIRSRPRRESQTKS